MTQSRLLTRRAWMRTAAAGALSAGLSGKQLLAAAAPASAIDLSTPDEGLINLAGNENPFGPAPAVLRTIALAAAKSCRYPFREEQVLKEMLAKREGVSVDNIVLTNGCDELIGLTVAEFAQSRSGEVVLTTPTYFSLPDYAEKFGLRAKSIPHDAATMRHDLVGMAAAVTSATRLVYLCNPDNPSGTLCAATEVAAFCREVAPRAPVFLDEVYLEMVDDFAAQTQVQLVREGLPVIIGRSFSKLHGMAGHRIGYGITTPALAAALSRWQMSSVNYLGVAAARVSLHETEFLAYSARKIREGRERFCRLLDELGLRYSPSHGNFVFHQLRGPVEEFKARMKARGFIVNWPHAPVEPYLDWCRISIGTDAEMTKYASAMRAEFSPLALAS